VNARDTLAQPDAPAQPAGQTAARMLVTLGKVIRTARRARGLSQEAFAERAQFDRTYPSLLERGQRDPRLSSLLRVCVALDCTLLQLLSAACAAESSSAEVQPGARPLAQPTRLRHAAAQPPQRPEST